MGLAVLGTQPHMEVTNSCSVPESQLRKSTLFGRMLPDDVFQFKKQSQLCVTAFVSVSVSILSLLWNFFWWRNIFFFFVLSIFRQSDAFQSPKIIRLTHFLQEAVKKCKSVADCPLAGQYSSSGERVCLHTHRVVPRCRRRHECICSFTVWLGVTGTSALLLLRRSVT